MNEGVGSTMIIPLCESCPIKDGSFFLSCYAE